MMLCATAATPIHFIDGKSYKETEKKNHKICLTNYTGSISHHIMELVINALGGRHTHSLPSMHINIADKSNFKKPGMHWHGLGLIIWLTVLFTEK